MASLQKGTEMKTLDEVIKSKELCNDHKFRCHECPYYDDDNEVGCRSDDLDADALHYLREYQGEFAYEARVNMADKFVNALIESEDNPPLTWDELKQMEGKPVWIEIGDGSKGWIIIRKINESGIVTGSDGFVGISDVYGMDTTWQAYRKERK